MTWQKELRCASGSKARLKKVQIFFRMYGSVMKPTSLYQAMSTARTVFQESQAPDEVLQRPLHSVKCTVWVAILKYGITGSFWFENDIEETMTVNKECYIVVLNKF